MINKKLIRKYLDGDCSPEEIKQVSLYLSNEDSNMDVLNEVLNESWDDTTNKETTAPPAQVDRIITSLRKELYPAPIHRLPANKHRLLWYAAAAVLIFAVAGIMHWQSNLALAGNKTTAATWKSLSNSGTRSMYAVLPDSSKVWLTPGAKLQYAADFNVQERTVRLNGEAFFEVAHHSAKPFIVYNGTIVTKVLGTAFNIEAYDGESTVRISLVSGKVAVTDSISTTQVQAGEMLHYHKATRTMKKEPLKYISAEQWTKGYIIFNEVPVSIALERIAARYNRKLVLGKDISLSQRRINTIFKHESLDEMLRLLLFVTRHRYVDDGHTITIQKNQRIEG